MVRPGSAQSSPCTQRMILHDIAREPGGAQMVLTVTYSDGREVASTNGEQTPQQTPQPTPRALAAPCARPENPLSALCPRARAFAHPQGRQLSSSALNGHDDPDTFEQEAASAGRLRRAFCSSGPPPRRGSLRPLQRRALAAQPRDGAPPRLKAIESYPRNISLSQSPSRIPCPAPLYPLANLSRARAPFSPTPCALQAVWHCR